MEKYHIRGGIPLEGEYRIKGAKNAALPILAATVCKSGIHEICECPDIGDVNSMMEILSSIGAKPVREEDRIIVDSRYIDSVNVPQGLMEKLRSSVFLMGSLLARQGEAVITKPGGCKIGKRPIDIHLNGLQQMGFSVIESGDKIFCSGVCKGGHVYLPYPSVGATENLMMAALSGNGLTVIHNCAREPEIEDLQGFLCTCGFRVKGAGTPEIRVEGGSGLRDGLYFVMEDRVEAATYMMATAGTGGNVIFENMREEYLKEIIEVLKTMGCIIRSEGDRVLVGGPKKLKSCGLVITGPYPGFPTDCQPQLMTIATSAGGTSMIREDVFESRFTHKKELVKMGADIETCGKNAIIKGNVLLKGAEVEALDLRGGAALVMAGLMAEGSTLIKGINHIERGYENLVEGFRSLGGEIEKTR